jgi:hypothetical protein
MFLMLILYKSEEVANNNKGGAMSLQTLTVGTGIPGMVASAINMIYGDRREPFTTSASTTEHNMLLMIVNLAIFFWALYYAFKCNSFFDYLAACCCSICYLAYRIARGCP